MLQAPSLGRHFATVATQAIIWTACKRVEVLGTMGASLNETKTTHSGLALSEASRIAYNFHNCLCERLRLRASTRKQCRPRFECAKTALHPQAPTSAPDCRPHCRPACSLHPNSMCRVVVKSARRIVTSLTSFTCCIQLCPLSVCLSVCPSVRLQSVEHANNSQAHFSANIFASCPTVVQCCR